MSFSHIKVRDPVLFLQMDLLNQLVSQGFKNVARILNESRLVFIDTSNSTLITADLLVLATKI